MKTYFKFVFIIIIFLLNGFFIYKGYYFLNNIRDSEAKSFRILAETSSSPQDKLILYIKSDILDPKDDKKFIIANLYSEAANYKKAKNYFLKIKNEESRIRHYETLIENRQFEAFHELRSNTDNEEMTDELLRFEKFSKGGFGVFEDKPAITNLGKILNMINTRDYSVREIEGKLGTCFRDQGSLVKKEIAASQCLIEYNQDEIARFLLDRIIKESPELSDAYYLLANIELKNKNYLEGISLVKKAINLDPSNEKYYELGIKISESSGDGINLGYFDLRLKTLKALIK